MRNRQNLLRNKSLTFWGHLISFPDAMGKFYHSKTYKALQNTENTLWAESAGYIADRYYEEQEEAQISK